MPALPVDFEQICSLAWQRALTTPGFIGEKEFRALLMLAAMASGPGALVEIGSYKGRSTLGLAALTRHLGREPIVSVDPHNAPSPTDPGDHSFEAFTNALERHDLASQVEVHRATSREVARTWSRPIRMLWIDGDHTLAGAREDLQLFAPFLSEGAIVAFHDTLHFFEGPIRVFVEDVLRTDHFAAAGFLHTIAWAQYHPASAPRWRAQRLRLARRASRLLPLVTPPRSFRGWNALRYRLGITMVPHSVPAPQAWVSKCGIS